VIDLNDSVVREFRNSVAELSVQLWIVNQRTREAEEVTEPSESQWKRRHSYSSKEWSES
jgi:hypothetical protein